MSSRAAELRGVSRHKHTWAGSAILRAGSRALRPELRSGNQLAVEYRRAPPARNRRAPSAWSGDSRVLPESSRECSLFSQPFPGPRARRIFVVPGWLQLCFTGGGVFIGETSELPFVVSICRAGGHRQRTVAAPQCSGHKPGIPVGSRGVFPTRNRGPPAGVAKCCAWRMGL